MRNRILFKLKPVIGQKTNVTIRDEITLDLNKSVVGLDHWAAHLGMLGSPRANKSQVLDLITG